MPITVNPHCIAQYLSWFLPVQWNIYIFKCQWSLTALSHRELQGINNDSGIVKICSYKSFHFFSVINLGWSVHISSFIFFSLPGASLPQSSSAVVWAARASHSGEGRTAKCPESLSCVCYWEPPPPSVSFVLSSSGWLIEPLSSWAMFQ